MLILMLVLACAPIDAGSARRLCDSSKAEAKRLVAKLGTNEEESAQARGALAAMGPNVIPVLVEACRASQQLTETMAATPGDRNIEEWDREAMRRAEIAAALSRVGEPAIPQLTALIKEKDACLETWLAAVEIMAREAVAMRDEPPPPALSQVVPYVIAALDAPEYLVRVGAVQALMALPVEGSEAAVPGLIRALTDERAESEGLRRDAADVLGRMGGLATAAVPALERARNDADRLVRAAAKRALQNIAATSTPNKVPASRP